MKKMIITAAAGTAIGAAAAGPAWVQVALVVVALALFVADSARRAARARY